MLKENNYKATFWEQQLVAQQVHLSQNLTFLLGLQMPENENVCVNEELMKCH